MTDHIEMQIPDDVMEAARASTVAYFNSFGADAEADAVANKDRDHCGEVQSAAWAIMAERERCEAALSAAEPVKPVCHLVWKQGRRSADDVEDYYEVARPGDKCVDGSDPFPVYMHPPALSVQVQDVAGWQLVPIEPTVEQVRACMRNGDGGLITPEYRISIYRAMIAAAPSYQKGI